MENEDVLGSTFKSAPASYTLEQLKCWLKCMGLKQAAEREDLLVRVNDCLKSENHHILDLGIDNGKWLKAKILRHRKPESLEVSIKTMPDVPLIPKTCWKALPSKGKMACHIFRFSVQISQGQQFSKNDPAQT